MKKKILLVSEYFPPKTFGGGELSAYNLAKSLSKKGFNVSVLTSFFEGLKKTEQKDGFKIIRALKTGSNPNSFFANLKRNFCFQKSLKKELLALDKKENFDLIHFLNTTSIPNFKINKKTFATLNSYTHFCPKRNYFYKEEKVCDGCKPGKFIGCLTHSDYIGKYKMPFLLKYNPKFWFYLYRTYKKHNSSIKNINKYFTRSDFIKNLLVKYGLKEKDVMSISGVVDMAKSEKKFNLIEKGITITFIGSLEKAKGIEMLIRAFNEVEHKDARLAVFGSGSQKDYLQSISSSHVNFYGQVEQDYLPSIYKQSDIIVHPALWPEPFSRVMVEALFYGKPIIATPNGGNPDGITEGKNGFLVKNEKELGEKLELLLENKKLREKMSLESKKLFKEKFEKEKVISKIINFYSK